MTREEILERGMQAPLYAGVLTDATHRGEGRNRDCGDLVHFDFKIVNGVITHARHSCQACVLTTAMTDCLCELVEGKTLESIKLPDPFSVFREPILPQRRECIQLPWELARVSLHLSQS